jgi:hypothetical protein
MPKSKNRKDHKKRVNARNQRIKAQRSKIQKIQHDMLMKMIEQEKNKGMFNNLPNIDSVGGDINIDGPVI